MKKTNIMIAFAVIGILLSCCIPTISAVETTIDLGTLGYRDYEYITISSDHEINLEFIYTDLNETDLLVEKIEFYPSTNETKYRFTSNEINPDFWFVPGIYDYIYQDMLSGQLYKVSVDYSSVIPPDNPYELLYDALCLDYGYLNISYNNLSTTYINVNESYNLLLQDMINISELYNSTILSLEQKTTEFANLSQAHMDLKTLFDNFNITYNATMVENKMWILRVGELSKYNDTFYKNMNSGYMDTFYFNGKSWTTPSNYERQIQGLKDDIKLLPLYIIIVGLIELTVFWIFYKRKISQAIPSDVQNERDTGYTNEAGLFDDYMTRVKNGAKKISETIHPKIQQNRTEEPEITVDIIKEPEPVTTKTAPEVTPEEIEHIKTYLTDESKEKIDHIISKKEKQ